MILKPFNKLLLRIKRQKVKSLVTDIRNEPLGEIYLFTCRVFISKDQVSKYVTFHYELSLVISIFWWRWILSIFLLHRNQDRKDFIRLWEIMYDEEERARLKVFEKTIENISEEHPK